MAAGERVVVLGGGVAGLSAAYYLARGGREVALVEHAPVLGGLCGSFEARGFVLDHGPHKLYSVVPGILDEIRRLLGDELIEHRKRNRIRLLGRYLDYPIRLGNLLPLLGPARAARLGLGYAGALAGSLLGRRAARSYREYLVQRFGAGVYELVFEPLAWKVWGDPDRIAAELAEARVPGGGPAQMLLRLVGLRPPAQDEDAPFFYYPRSGFGAFPRRLAEEVQAAGGRLLTSASPRRLVRGPGGGVEAVEVERAGRLEVLPCDILVSSIPIHALAELLFPGDAAVAEEASALRFRDLALVYLFLERDRLLDDHWIFFPEREYPFNRLFEQKAMSPQLGPQGRTAVCCDLTCDEGDAVWSAGDDELVRRCFESLVRIGLTGPESLEGGLVRRFRRFYPMYTPDYRERLGRLYGRLRAADNLLLTGRLGMFNYNNSDHCLDMGRFLAEGLDAGRACGEVWSALEERVRAYRIVD